MVLRGNRRLVYLAILLQAELHPAELLAVLFCRVTTDQNDDNVRQKPSVPFVNIRDEVSARVTPGINKEKLHWLPGMTPRWCLFVLAMDR